MHESSLDLWDLPHKLRTLVENELDEGEQIVWIGTPNSKRFVLYSIPIVLFGIPWTAFSVFWVFAASGFQLLDFSQGFGFFPLFGLPFVFIGFGMLSSPFWMSRKAKRIAYLITNKRAIIFDGGWSTTIRSFFPDRLNNLTRKQYSDGSGDLIFEQGLILNHDGNNNSTPQTTARGFLAIPNVKEIERLVRELADHEDDHRSLNR